MARTRKTPAPTTPGAPNAPRATTPGPADGRTAAGRRAASGGGGGAAVAAPDPDGEADRDTIAGVGPRLRALRSAQDVTLTALAAATGISISTLSRLESGARRPSLELLLPIARTLAVPLDELLDRRPTAEPRVHSKAQRSPGMVMWPLTQRPGPLHAFKALVSPTRLHPNPRSHSGYVWLYVLSGRLRLLLGEHDLVLEAGEVAEFDAHVQHWMGSTGEGSVEYLCIGSTGEERMHVRASPRTAKT